MGEDSSLATSAASVKCENCGGPVAGDAPAGLCPNCLLRTAIEHGASRALAPFLPRLHYFGDYELLEEVARGGMGVVYRARQVSLDRTVAVKMMRPGLLASETEIQRFRTEAKTAGGLQHPNIVAIHEVGQFDGLHYFSMDFVEGPNLAALVRERPLSSPECARYVQALAETIGYAHARGVLHRDLKPSNVLVDAAGRPRITDFGLARHLEKDTDMTPGGAVVGTLIGTPAYMPPEQASGRDDQVGATADVYSLGAILYELLTGQPPFRASTQAETVRMVLDAQPVAPSRLNPDVDAHLEAICLRCLEKDPAKRFQTAGDLAAALQGSSADGSAVPPRRRWSRNKWLAFAAVVVAAAAIGIAGIMMTARKPLPQRAVRDVVVLAPPATEVVVPKPSPVKKASTPVALPPALPVPLPLPPSPPGISVSPASGSGFSQVFTIHYVDAPQIEIDIHDAEPDSNRHCDVLIDTATGEVRLQAFPDRGPGIRVGSTLGLLTRPDNSVCALDMSKGSFGRSEISLPVIFKPGFEGEKVIDTWRTNAAGLRLEKGQPGSWNAAL